MSFHKRLVSLLVVDSLIVFTSVYICSFLLFSGCVVPTMPLALVSTTLLLSHHIFAYKYKLYKSAWEYASVDEMVTVLKAVTFSVITAAIIQYIIGQQVYFRILTTTWMMHLFLIGGSRFSWRIYKDKHLEGNNKVKKRTLIIGAGSAGMFVARQLKQSNGELIPVAFIDDDKQKQHLEILGIPVHGSLNKLDDAVKDLMIENIVIAIPSLNKKELHDIYVECTKTKINTQMMPMFEDLVTGKVSVNEIRNVEPGDLLGREPVELDTQSIAKYITNSVVLVTGAGGSIGSEICRQVSQFSPSKLILLGHGENSIYTIEMELKSSLSNKIEIVTEIADITDRDKIFAIMNEYKPRVVFHAAAHKHVPLMERNPEEAIKNNVIGTKNVAEAAGENGVETFVMISTDKAVNPTSVMGATKRIAEMIVQELDRKSNTRFVAVRFGNVLGSRGSVIPLFKDQILKGGPVTVTDPQMTRYFMTIPEASRLVLQAGALAQGGEIFVLDMGEPVKIVDLAKNLIRLSGYLEDEIEITYSGIRPGEKLFEEILNKNEVQDYQVHPKIFVGKSVTLDVTKISNLLENYYYLDRRSLKEILLFITNQSKETMKVVV
ncbi:NDP-sugar epimerase, includes UDP-GlcNAc-inverting 4,6-dehydratase FlaA1 and capsular polysaccharide biosynthesis protein EpsC [Bacillus sp. OV166]|uniref:polysaccharide biosynthesis protein n=1 Tax=Bacillus sp. OV166 TaxID=1882763 RepID=UPI000A2ABE4D|nr:nucleoside-diphosphate sugar epimerase/dehydratase [Bacillus sp. OV166]SMQ83799.1 NDP-sugar epimerase, includes UDP-GlcNAc-inverting 4,6-dehydratase FlaA1 and capsular polysaccharide biosynthesis protein EpsC [Bacillus sp. OV166]